MSPTKICPQLERNNIIFRLQSGYKQYREKGGKGGKVGRKPGSVKSVEQKREEYKDVAKLCKNSVSSV